MTLTNEDIQDILAGVSEEEQKALSNVYNVILNN